MPHNGHWTVAATMSRNEVTAPLTFQPVFVERTWRDEKMFDVRGLMFDVEDSVAA
jgi:hypothetical protein